MRGIDNANTPSDFIQDREIKNQRTYILLILCERTFVRGARLNKNLRGILFTQRAVGIWNELPEFRGKWDKQKQINSLGGTSWSPWTSCVKGPVFMLYNSIQENPWKMINSFLPYIETL